MEPKKHLTTIVVSMYNAGLPAIEVVDKVFFPGLLNNASSDKQLVLLDDCSPLEKETDEMVEKYRPELEKRFGDVIIGRNPGNVGFGASYNRGMGFADGDILLIVNDDVYLPKGSAGSLIRTLLEDSSYGLVGPVAPRQWSFQNCLLGPEIKQYSKEEMEKAEKFAEWLRKVMKGRRYSMPNSRVMGSCYAVRNTPEAYFDERFTYGFWEDVDLNERMRRNGKKIILDPSVYVWHKLNTSTYQHKAKFWYYLARNSFTFIKKWGNPMQELYNWLIMNIQGQLDQHVITKHIVKQAKEQGFWKEYQEKFGK